MPRPDNLPDFRNPPLTEVAIGIQFNPPAGYQQIRAYEVWDLFRSHYPIVEEHQALAPQFELFGRPQGQSMNFGLVTGAVHNRFFFLSESGNDIIQFQKDRLLHNWRKTEGTDCEYPRYERMVGDFEHEVNALFDYLATFGEHRPEITQCEITYVNTIDFDGDDKPENWLRIFEFGNSEPDDFSLTTRRTIFDDNGTPLGRLIVEATIGYSADGSKGLMLNLTARGKPKGTSLGDALEFLAKNREMIVVAFAELTSDSAHKKWERV